MDLQACLARTRATPDDDLAWQALGVAYLEHNHPLDAAAAFARALGVNPHNAPAAEGLVLAARQTGRWETVVPVLERASAPGARLGLALAAFQRGDMASAATLFRQVLDAAPDDAEAAYNLASSLGNLARWAEAAEVFEVFLRLQPRDAAAWRGLGRSRSASHQYDRAVDAYRRAIDLAGDAAGCHLQLGKALGDVGRWQEAADVLRTAARLDPQSPVAFTALAFTYARMAEGEGVEDAARWTRERCLRAQVGALEMSLRLKDDNAAGWRALARAREALGDHGGAREANAKASEVARQA